MSINLPENNQRSALPLGGSALRTDSLAKVTGQALYAGDRRIPGMLHLKVVRSLQPHARLTSLDISQAANMPGIRCVITSADIPGVNGFPYYSNEEPVLTGLGDTLRMVGAPIALVVAESAIQGEAALQAIKVDLELLPSIPEMEDALRSNCIPIAGESNILSTYELKHNDNDMEAAFAPANSTVEASFRTSYLTHAALESESLLGFLDENSRVTVIGGAHQPHRMQRFIAEMLAVPPDQVRVTIPPTGGSFGSKQDPWPFLAVGLAVHLTKQPVSLIYSRPESFIASPKRHPYDIGIRIGATREGFLTGLRVRIDCNTGGYDSGGRFIPNFALTAAVGPYRWQAVDGVARSVYTTGPKSGQFRGFGTAQSTFALECALDELIERLDQDAVEFRMQNCLEPPNFTMFGYPLTENLGYRQVLEAIQPYHQEFKRNSEAYNKDHPEGPIRHGVGLSGMWYRFGKAGEIKTEAQAELASDGHFIIYCSAPDYGQGTNTTMSQIAADAFGVSRERVEVINADTAQVPDSDIQGASRATFFVGGAIIKAAESLVKEILGVAAEVLDLPAKELAIDIDKVISVRNKLSLSLAEVALEFDRMGKSRRIVDYFDLNPSFPKESRPEYLPFFVTGANLAEVAVDMETGLVRVQRVVAVHDVGRVINRLDAQGQVEGAVIMGMGAALMEEYLPGQTTGLSNYLLPTVEAIPEIKVILVEVPSKFGHHGVKGLGEAAMLPSTPAIICAVSRAIGYRMRTIPATPERILAAIQRRPDKNGTLL